MIVSDIVAHFAVAHPHRPAVVDRGIEVSYAELQARIVCRARSLLARGVRGGDRVAVLASNCTEYVEAVCALSRIGAVWVPVNNRLTTPEVAHILRDSQATGLYFTAELRATAQESREEAGGEIWCDPLEAAPVATGHGNGSRPPKAVEPSPDAAFCIMYTSGTTGRPKGAVLTHRQLISGAYYLKCGMGIGGQDRILQCLPLFHAGGAIYHLAHLLAGATVLLLPRFEPELVEATTAEQEATTLGLVPTMMHALAERGARFWERTPSLRRVVYGGSSIDPNVLLRMMDRSPAEFIQTYGQTEAGVIVTVLDGAAHRRARDGEHHLLASCGRPLLGYQVRLAWTEADGAKEITVRSDSVMRGYWQRPDATAATLVDGWLRTGDIGRWDADGYLYVVDRRTALIISGGENVYPLEVERALCTHPQVDEAAVVGVPDERWGEVVKAVVVASGPPPDPDELRRHCRGRIAGFKVPKIVEYVSALPRNASGKVTKHLLEPALPAGRAGDDDQA